MWDKEKQREYNRRRHEEEKLAYKALMTCYPFTLDDLPDEQWRPIKGFDKYQVSTYGRVKSFWRKTPRILKPKFGIGGYMKVEPCANGKPKSIKIHRLVAETFIPNPLNKPEVNHEDGHHMNCFVENLTWATSSENRRHAYDSGLAKSGVDNSCAKIKSETDIVYIRDNPDNLTQQQLAEMFGVHPTAIGQIQLGKSYANEGGTVRETQKRGWYHRIPDDIRAQIRADWATGLYTKAALARKYGVSHGTIRNIVNESA